MSEPKEPQISFAYLLNGVELTPDQADRYFEDPAAIVDDFGPDGAIKPNALQELWRSTPPKEEM